MALPLTARLLCLAAAALAAPAPGRVPKVYNALITSNQNLEPSKAYPVYQPVLHDPFAFPYQPVYYGDFPLSNGLLPAPAVPPQGPSISQQPPSPPQKTADEEPTPSSTASPPAGPPASPPAREDAPPPADQAAVTPAPPLPPNTQSPIPLNEFGLPPQVLPLGRINPAYNGFTQVGPFTYPYPKFRFYDPFDPFSFSPYSSLASLYRPLPNILEQGVPVIPVNRAPSLAQPEPPSAQPQPAGDAPPPEPSDLNPLNYSSKDPAIPNVPPPPLPDGGLKSDNAE